jgi:type I restriction enzyme S subunit
MNQTQLLIERSAKKDCQWHRIKGGYRLSKEARFGDIPAHWIELPLKRVSKTYAGGTPDRDNPHFWEEGEIPWINSGAVNQRNITTPSALITEEGFRRSSAKWVPCESLVIALAGQGKTKAMVAQLKIATTCNQSLAAICPNESILPRYLFWLLQSQYEMIRGMAGDEQRDGLNLTHIGSIPILRPPLDEQWAIAWFLDRETAEIDRLTEAKAKAVHLVETQRNLQIARIVNLGLNRCCQLKNSESKYWKEVPSHWQMKEVRYLTPDDRRIMYGIVLPGPNVDDGVFIVKGGNCEPGRLKPEFLARTTYEIESGYARSRLKAGDIVYAIRGSMGAAEIVPEALEGANLTQDAARISPRQDIHNRWVLHAVRTPQFFGKLEAGATGATIRGINIRDLKRTCLPIPPLNEQREIAAEADAITLRHDCLMKGITDGIKLLEEYRSALISAAVTGQIDVRKYRREAPCQ